LCEKNKINYFDNFYKFFYILIMTRLTDEEYAALDEKWTRETPMVNFSRPGMFARQRLLLESLDTPQITTTSLPKPPENSYPDSRRNDSQRNL
jgi:hypothetical protein